MFTSTRTLLFLTVTVIASLLLVACQAVNVAEPPASDPGKNITIAIAEDPPSFNPMVIDTGYDDLVMELVMLGLTDVDPEGNVFPELAAELPTVENGGVAIDEDAGTMSVTLKMRQDIQWQDERPVTADDVLFTWLAIFPGLMIFISIISVNYIGDGLRDAFDPYKVLETVGKYT